MKKTLFLAAAAIFAAGTLFSAEALKINGDFKNVVKGKSFPAGWSKNGNGVKDAAFEIVKDGENNVLKFVSQGKHTALFTHVTPKAADNDKFEVVIVAKGKADEFFAGVYAYGEKNKYLNSYAKKFVIDSPDKFTEYKGEFKVGSISRGKTEYVRVFMGGYTKGFDLQIKEIRVTPIEEKAAEK